jgi:hypothetical protein
VCLVEEDRLARAQTQAFPSMLRIMKIILDPATQENALPPLLGMRNPRNVLSGLMCMFNF